MAYPVGDSPKAPASPASSFLSDAFDGDAEPPTKRRRVSFSESSLSSESASSSGDEEEQPLAARRATRAGKDKLGGHKHNGKGKKSGGPRAPRQRTGGKSMSSMKSKPQAAGTGKAPATEGGRPTQASMSPIMTSHELPVVKVEDKMDESQLNRLATGVTVDTGGATATAVSLCVLIGDLRLCSPPL